MGKKVLVYIKDEEKLELYKQMLSKFGFGFSERIEELISADLNLLLSSVQLLERGGKHD